MAGPKLPLLEGTYVTPPSQQSNATDRAVRMATCTTPTQCVPPVRVVYRPCGTSQQSTVRAVLEGHEF